MTLSRRSLLKTLGSAAAVASVTPLSSALAAGAIKPGKQSVLLVIDVQNCFLPTGTLPVKDGDQVVPVINELSKKFQNVVMTQDWHPAGHSSFASSHDGKAPFETVEMDYGTQVLWPDHCIQGTKDAELAPGLDIPHAQLIIRKGWNSAVDSYSAFREADKKTMTGLTGYLKERGISDVYVCGLATDFCVAWSAIDGTISEFNVSVIEDASRGIDLNGSVATAWADMKKAGIARIQSGDFA
ncbi:bifunctional nicotinamidase/pyrazinamidase [Roseibium polysiphoniae]|uniref:nicotinamidase n=1 Tax=Roseibium polysiphoniae TaxID=2571221 RepID=A0ABR9C672_9HYPH|nr:bifunctional nicotinamidase/pyrazinamidase [Roseibium polysiphoniae]MBD8875388.1 bifunctional nicotinamidase/pyrazinamidase [Roseibium polysiphoniae]